MRLPATSVSAAGGRRAVLGHPRVGPVVPGSPGASARDRRLRFFVHDLPNDLVVNALWSLAHIRYPAAAVARLQQRAFAVARSFSEADVAVVIWALGRLAAIAEVAPLMTPRVARP